MKISINTRLLQLVQDIAVSPRFLFLDLLDGLNAFGYIFVARLSLTFLQ